MTTVEGGEPPLDWNVLVPPTVSPTKVAIVEALLYVGQPLSASELAKLFDDPELNVPRISYHLATLADNQALRTVQAPGTSEKSFFLSNP
jgi:hypothetical protein